MPTAKPPTPPLPITRLTCHAPHKDPRRPADLCGELISDDPGAIEFVGLVARIPDAPIVDPETGEAYGHRRCPKCKAVNRVRIVSPLPAPAFAGPAPDAVPGVRPGVVPEAPPPSLEQRFTALEPLRQHAVLAMAGGLGVAATARQLGVNRKTITRWKADESFMALVRDIAPALSQAHVRAALAGFMEILEQDRKKGVAHNHRWLLARTIFRDFEQQRAAAGSSSVTVNNNVQQSQLLQGAIASTWEKKRGLAALADD